MPAILGSNDHCRVSQLPAALPARPTGQLFRVAKKPRRETRRGMAAGWVIALRERQPLQCLQLATGQWCAPENATWFPIRSAAANYAVDLGYSIGHQVELVFLEE